MGAEGLTLFTTSILRDMVRLVSEKVVALLKTTNSEHGCRSQRDRSRRDTGEDSYSALDFSLPKHCSLMDGLVVAAS